MPFSQIPVNHILDRVSFNAGANAIISRVELLCFPRASDAKMCDTFDGDDDSSQGARLLHIHMIHHGSLILSWYSRRVIRIMKKRATLKLATRTTHLGMSPTHFCSLFKDIS